MPSLADAGSPWPLLKEEYLQIENPWEGPLLSPEATPLTVSSEGVSTFFAAVDGRDDLVSDLRSKCSTLEQEVFCLKQQLVAAEEREQQQRAQVQEQAAQIKELRRELEESQSAKPGDGPVCMDVLLRGQDAEKRKDCSSKLSVTSAVYTMSDAPGSLASAAKERIESREQLKLLPLSADRIVCGSSSADGPKSVTELDTSTKSTATSRSIVLGHQSLEETVVSITTFSSTGNGSAASSPSLSQFATPCGSSAGSPVLTSPGQVEGPASCGAAAAVAAVASGGGAMRLNAALPAATSFSTAQPKASSASAQRSLSATTGLPATHEAFLWLHNRIALPMMKRTQDLGKAYQHFGEANAIHFRVHGQQSSEAIYNQACCLSLGAAALQFAEKSRPGCLPLQLAPGLPPVRPEALARDVADARLDLAAATLDAAIEVGYSDTENMLNDPDVQTLRQMRPEQFAAAQRRARMRQDEAAAAATRIRALGGGSLPLVNQGAPQRHLFSTGSSPVTAWS